MVQDGQSWIRQQSVQLSDKDMLSYYGKDYFTKYPYNQYQDFPRHDVAFGRFVRMLRPVSVLDIGCAYGYIVRRCIEAGIPAVGMDVSQWCGLQHVISCYVRGTAWALPFKGKSFDVIHCEGVLEHLPEDRMLKIMKEFERVAHRYYLGICYDDSDTEGHICIHPSEWWMERVPPGTYLGLTGRSLDIEDEWYYKG